MTPEERIKKADDRVLLFENLLARFEQTERAGCYKLSGAVTTAEYQAMLRALGALQARAERLHLES